MKKNKVILLIMLLLLLLFPTAKNTVFSESTAQDDYGEYYDSMMLKGSWSEEEFLEFKAKSRAFEKQEDSDLGIRVTYVILLSALYYLAFLWLVYFFIKREDFFSSTVAVLFLIVLFFL